MSDETASALLKYAQERLVELLRQEFDIKGQISHWSSVVEGLAKPQAPAQSMLTA